MQCVSMIKDQNSCISIRHSLFDQACFASICVRVHVCVCVCVCVHMRVRVRVVFRFAVPDSSRPLAEG